MPASLALTALALPTVHSLAERLDFRDLLTDFPHVLFEGVKAAVIRPQFLVDVFKLLLDPSEMLGEPIHPHDEGVLLARTAFKRVFKKATLFWEQVSP